MTWDVPDFVRVVALFEALVSAVLAGLSLYFFTQRRPPKVLLAHVIRVSLTYFAFVAFGVVEVTTHFGHGWRWELFGEMVIFGLAANSHVPLVRYEWQAAKQAQRDGD